MAGEMPGGAEVSLGRRLREAGPEELRDLIEAEAERLDAQAALQALRNPHCDRFVIGLIVDQRRLLSYYELRRRLTLHPRTPRVDALRFLNGLYWNDLLDLCRDMQVHPALRRAGERRLGDRVQAMTIGEKVNVARRASRGVLAQLRNDPNPRVARAMLRNPVMTEGLLLPLASNERASPEVLATLADDPRWGVRYPLRVALCKNVATPVPSALKLLPMLKKRDLMAVASDRRLRAPVRRRAEVLLGRA